MKLAEDAGWVHQDRSFALMLGATVSGISSHACLVGAVLDLA
jgi:hypothetical protein